MEVGRRFTTDGKRQKSSIVLLRTREKMHHIDSHRMLILLSIIIKKLTRYAEKKGGSKDSHAHTVLIEWKPNKEK